VPETVRSVVAAHPRRRELPAQDVDAAVTVWERLGFSPRETRAWLDAGCVVAGTARRLSNLGIQPEDAAQPVGGDPRRSIAWSVASGTLSAEDALVLVERRRQTLQYD
jgi:hypothetical protein